MKNQENYGMVIRCEEGVWVQETCAMSLKDCKDHVAREYNRYGAIEGTFGVLKLEVS
jgi:hypothetical protein